MKIFMTGGTGYIGSAVARAASEAGHQVLAAAHSAQVAADLAASNVTPVAGDLARPASLVEHAQRADAVIHVGFAAGPDAADIDRRATEALVGSLGGSGRPFVYTSGVWVLGSTGDSIADETSPTAPIALVAWRASLERWLREASDRGAHTIIVRPGVVHGNGGGIPGQMATGKLPMIDGGAQRWAVVHVEDLAALYLAAIERAAAGEILHGVGEVITVGDLMRGAPGARSEDFITALGTLGDFAEALAIDQSVSSERTQLSVGWAPSRFVTASTLATAIA